MRRWLRAFGAALLLLTGSRGALALDPALRRQAKDPEPLVRCDAARSLAKDGSPDAARVLSELFSDRDPHVRDAAVIACEILADRSAVPLLATGIRARDELARRNCAEALGRTGKDTAIPALAELAGDPSAAVRADAVDALARFPDDAKALEIAKSAASDRDPFVRAAAVESAVRVGPADAARAIVQRALTDMDDGVRCVARGSWRLLDPAAALADLGDAASDPSWRVRAQCVEDAEALRERPAIDALVALVGDPRTRVAAAAHRALGSLTGLEIGRDRDLWTAWWKSNRAAWSAPTNRSESADDPRRTVAQYHGLDVVTDAAVFVADLSGSMREAVGGGDSRTRWTVAAEELRRTFAALPSTFTANLVFFQTEPRAAFPKAQPLTRAARDKAEAFIAGGSPRESGNFLAAVLLALDDDAIDTLYVLSDGEPSAGDMVEKNRVRAAIRQRNRTRKCVIDTIAFGARRPTDRAFLDALARDSGGRSR